MTTTYRTILIGDSGSGKSTLLDRLAGLQFDRNVSSTIGVDFRVVEGIAERPLRIWDTAGAERFQSVMSIYYRKCDFCMLVFDASRNQHWKPRLLNWAQSVQSFSPDVRILIIGNKVDRDQTCDTDDVVNVARKIGAVGVVFVSAKHMSVSELREYVRPLFQTLPPLEEQGHDMTTRLLGGGREKTKQHCCTLI